jgi:hypothetical protein
MYSAAPENDLLQGDVVRRVPLNRWIGLTRQDEKPGLHSGRTHQAQWKEREMSMVLISHSCDTAVKNATKRLRLIVSPLQPIDAGLKEKVEGALGSLEALNRKPETGQKDFLNLFYYAKHEKISEVPLVADFSILHSVDRSLLTVEMKVLQLEDDVREAFRYKLGFNFARAEDDDPGPPSPPAAPPPG